MSKILESALELIGKTPLLKLNKYSAKAGIKDAVIYGKLEYLNLSGSVKDRIALAMIEDAEKKGLLKRAQLSLSRLPAIQVSDLQPLPQQKVTRLF